MIVAIHQPNFFPWLGFFDKIIKSDIFIFLDHVQFPKSEGNWTNRVKLLVGGDVKWITAPLNRQFRGVKSICDMTFNSMKPWRHKLIKTIQANYRKAPYYDRVMDCLEPLILNPEHNISKYNTYAILNIAEQIGIAKEKFYWSSNLPYSGTANEMLISLTKVVGGSCYMCGAGANEYQDDNAFSKSGIELLYQKFEHPEYSQFNMNPFISGLSIIDALMNCDFSGVKNMLDK